MIRVENISPRKNVVKYQTHKIPTTQIKSRVVTSENYTVEGELVGHAGIVAKVHQRVHAATDPYRA